ncbi:hypothetical protein [Mycoplasmopsis felifaucium]|uniref:hypothetical protein n=1 Tax=Mycoplasmopsis felifaucium TaxID=35768 RepID=UPI000487ABB2|nr:hypothetical protein [Mycoplasmopsis felifaucium]
MNKRNFLKYYLSPVSSLSTIILSSSCHKIEDPSHPINKNNREQRDITEINNPKNYDLDFTQYGIKNFNGNLKVRTLIYPAATRSNKMDKNGIFNIKLHLAPVKGATGEWLAFATEVKSTNDNTLVKPVVIKIASAIAEPSKEYPLKWSFDGDQKLESGKFYTFVFYKKDGSEVIVFSQKHIANNKDIFPAVLPSE